MGLVPASHPAQSYGRCMLDGCSPPRGNVQITLQATIHWFLIADLINDHRHSSCKQYKLIIFQCCSSEVQPRLTRANARGWQDCVPPGGPRGESISLSFPVCGSRPQSLAHGRSFSKASQVTSLSSSLYPLIFLTTSKDSPPLRTHTIIVPLGHLDRIISLI